MHAFMPPVLLWMPRLDPLTVFHLESYKHKLSRHFNMLLDTTRWQIQSHKLLCFLQINSYIDFLWKHLVNAVN